MSEQSVSQSLSTFYQNLTPFSVPDGISILNPYTNSETFSYSSLFLEKFYNDSNPRILIFGINPGRFGGGITGVNFTDPIALSSYCGIPNTLPQKHELSSEFIYSCISAFGGVAAFYSQFYLSAMCPLGFTKDGKNYNYYDDPFLLDAATPFIVSTLRQQIAICKTSEVCILLGTGKNQKFFSSINKTYHFFKRILILEHPRFIMQYRRSQVSTYVNTYVLTFSNALSG
jgi:hypothetical protein